MDERPVSSESPASPASDDPWDASWEGARRQMLESARAATPAQRLAWLEEMLEIAYRAGALKPPGRDERS